MYGPGVPSLGGPGLADEATDGNDRVGEVEEGVDDVLVPFVAALQAVEGVAPGTRRWRFPAGSDPRCGNDATGRADSFVRAGSGWPRTSAYGPTQAGGGEDVFGARHPGLGAGPGGGRGA